MEEQQPQQQDSENPFIDLNISSHEPLENIKSRSFCPKCHASRKYFCYTCIVPMPEIASSLPNVSLPIHIDIVKHPKEIDGKSTAIHAAIIAPNDVTLYTYPDIPQFEDRTKVLLVYPSDNAVSLRDLVHKLPKPETVSTTPTKLNGASIHSDGSKPPEPKRTKYAGERGDNGAESEAVKTLGGVAADDESHESEGVRQFERVVFIDSTWNQSNQIFRDERFKDLQCVILNTKKTHFWRTQGDKPDTYLATIEAIYYFILEYHQEILKTDHQGHYDNLLYFFTFMHKLVQKSTAEVQGLSREEKQLRHRRRTEVTTLEAQLRRQKESGELPADLSPLLVDQPVV